MKYLYCIFFLVLSTLCLAHKNVNIAHEFENLSLLSSTCFYTEEINRNLIIGEYANLLLEKRNFKQKVKLRIIQDEIEDFTISATNNSKNGFDLEITIISKTVLIPETIYLINYILNDYNNFKNENSKKYYWGNILIDENVIEVLNQKIYRPKWVTELETIHNFNYYFQNNSFFIEQTLFNQTSLVLQTKSILQIKPIKFDLLVVVSNDEIISIISTQQIWNQELEKYDYNISDQKIPFPKTQNFCFEPYKIELLSDFIFFEEAIDKQLHAYSISNKKMIENVDRLIR